MAFQIKDTEDMTERVRRAIGQADVDAPRIQRLIAAVESSGHEVEAPISLKDCWAHLGVRKLKLVIYSKEHLEYPKIEFERRLWESHGWKLIAIAGRKINTMSDESLRAQFKLALAELGKRK